MTRLKAINTARSNSTLLVQGRLNENAHTPASAAAVIELIGWSCAWVGVMLAHHWQWGCHTVTTHILVIILTIASASLFFHDHGYPTALHLTKAVAIFCTLSGLLCQSSEREVDLNRGKPAD